MQPLMSGSVSICNTAVLGTPGLHTTMCCCIVANHWPVPTARCSVLFWIPIQKALTPFSAKSYAHFSSCCCVHSWFFCITWLTSFLAMTVQCQRKVMNRQQNFCSLQGVLCMLLTLLCCNYQTIRVLIMSVIQLWSKSGLSRTNRLPSCTEIHKRF